METPMQTLAAFCRKQAKGSANTEVSRALMGIVSVINATCIGPEKQAIIGAFDLGFDAHILDTGQDGEQYYNETFKQ